MNVARTTVNAIGGSPILPQTRCCGRARSCCSFVNLSFLRTTEGVLKLIEIILGLVCQNLLSNYGVTYSLSLGSSYNTFLTTVSASVLTSVVLLLCYLVSSKSFQLVRQSLFETLFNGISCLLYFSSSGYLAFAIYTFLYPIYKLTSVFQVYPTMSLTYIVGIVLGCAHGYDSWLAYKKFR